MKYVRYVLRQGVVLVLVGNYQATESNFFANQTIKSVTTRAFNRDAQI